MKGHWSKAVHASSELVAYFIKKGARDIDNHYRFINGALEVCIIAKDLVIPKDELEALRKLIMPEERQSEIGEYYWGLAGGEHRGTELEVVANVAEVIEVRSSESGGTTIRLRRLEKN